MSRIRRYNFTEQQKGHLIKLYQAAKAAPTGTDFQCGWCGDTVTSKTSRRQAFCRNGELVHNSCREQFHNVFNPRIMKDGVIQRDLDATTGLDRNRTR